MAPTTLETLDWVAAARRNTTVKFELLRDSIRLAEQFGAYVLGQLDGSAMMRQRARTAATYAQVAQGAAEWLETYYE